MSFVRQVVRSPDFDRILALPRRVATPAAGEAASAILTPMLAKRPGVRLRWAQGLGLLEMAELRAAGGPGGAYLGLAPGMGKSLVTWLAPSVLDAQRPLLLVPGSLVDDTWTKFHSYSADWVAPPNEPFQIRSFEELQQESNVDLLFRLQPDCLVIDEAHRQRNQDKAIVKRLARYIAATPKLGIRLSVVTLTGSQIRLQIQEFSHLLTWSLDEGAPVPLNPNELSTWGDALNETEPRLGQRPGVGVIADLAPNVRGPTKLSTGRRAFMDRLIHTKGVLIADDSECDAPLTISFLNAPEDPELNTHFEVWRKDWQAPDGQVASDIFSQIRLENQLGSGLFLYWDPQPPPEWRLARKDAADFVRDRIAHSGRDLDTERAVLNAYKRNPIVERWREVKPTFKPHTKPRWLSRSVAKFVADWLRAAPGCVFVQNPEFGEACAAAAKCRYFGSGGTSADGLFVEKERPGASAVLSMKANSEGRNLQFLWNRVLIVGLERNANELEQCISRVHRSLQTKPVSVEILATSGATFRKSWARCLQQAEFALEMTPHRNKILDHADIIWQAPSEALRWA